MKGKLIFSAAVILLAGWGLWTFLDAKPDAVPGGAVVHDGRIALGTPPSTGSDPGVLDDSNEEGQPTDESSFYESPMPNPFVFDMNFIEDPRQQFDLYYRPALGGDSEAQYIVSDILQNCVNLEGIEGPEHLEALYSQGLIHEDVVVGMKSLSSDCAYFRTILPDGTFWDWASELRQDSADGGYLLAKSRLLLDKASTSKQDLVQLAELLEMALDGGGTDHRAPYLVSLFYRKQKGPSWQPNDWRVPTMGWKLVGCRKHRPCDQEVMERNLRLEYQPHEAAEILQFAARIENLLTTNSAIELGLLVSYASVSPDDQ